MEVIQLNINRFPLELKEQLKKFAEEERRSLPAQIIFVLEEYARSKNASN